MPIKRITDLMAYTSVLPYASELFGIYQPLLGWKSKRMIERFESGFEKDRAAMARALARQFAGIATVAFQGGNALKIALSPGTLQPHARRMSFDSLVLESIAKKLPSKYSPKVWQTHLDPEKIVQLLQKTVAPAYSDLYTGMSSADPLHKRRVQVHAAGNDPLQLARQDAIASQLKHESAVAGMLLHLAETKNHKALYDIFYKTLNGTDIAQAFDRMMAASDSIDAYVGIETLDPQERVDIRCAALSPIGVVHLFRQYFFELDSFLGTPVSHVWLSPGAEVELIEIHTRKDVVEKTLETALDSLIRTEKDVTEQDELSDAVKQDNKTDIKFGASVTASYASVKASSSFDYNNSQQVAREETHKKMRQQTEKLSTEIRRSFKSTFKTVTEISDVSNKRYLLKNATEELINYELRRKMRQVGVQVQDIGTYLCWQAYVDDPGQDLGIAKLVHIAQPADLDGIPHPEEIPALQPFTEEKMVSIPCISTEDEKEAYQDGVEVDREVLEGDPATIQTDFAQTFICAKSNYALSNVEIDSSGKPVLASLKGDIANAGNKASFTIYLNYVDFQGQAAVDVKLILHWTPDDGLNAEIAAKNAANVAAFTAKEEQAFKKAFVNAARERVKLCSKIQQRKSDELRDEERIVIYRQLVQGLLLNKVPMVDDRSRHVVAELISSIFDIDKMLYFVAPEWWRPRLHHGAQELMPEVVDKGTEGDTLTKVKSKIKYHALTALGAVQTTAQVFSEKLAGSVVGWGGLDEVRRHNYYITEDSDPARFGSSLGWLLQLDGDNLRNAFLNAPWVKAVVPIRPGKERAAINWLKGVEGMNGITDADVYHTDGDERDSNGKKLDGQKLLDVIYDLAKKVEAKHKEGIKTALFPPELQDDTNQVTATPIDRVYEHGFYPLQGGFKADVEGNYEIFDQWVEVLPTDQVVPVEVKYDPKTGRMM